MTGFKQAEIGTLPEDWEIKHIENIILASVGGGTPSTKVKAYWDGDIHWTTSKRLSDKLYLMDGEKRISNQALESTSTKLVPSENVIVSTRVTVGKAMVNKIDIAISQDLTGLLIDKQHYLPEFVAYQLKTEQIQSIFESQKRGATIKGITREDLENIPLLCPPFSEQGKIVRVLWLIQSAIETQEKIIQTTTELKKALMLKLFTEGLKGEPQKETEIGLAPKSWEVVKVDDLGGIVTGTTPPTKKKEYYENGGFQFISPVDLGETKYVNRTEKEISSEGLKVSRVLPKDTVLVVCIGSTTGKVGLTSQEKSTTNQQINAIICNGNFNPHFIYYILDFKKNYIRSLSTPSPVPILTKGQFQKAVIPITKNKQEQDGIAKVLSVIDEKTEQASRKKQTLRSLFKSMLHHLMTGQIRVKDLRFS